MRCALLLQLYRRNRKGEQKHGKDLGPDGTQLIRIDGPHAAPAQVPGGCQCPGPPCKTMQLLSLVMCNTPQPFPNSLSLPSQSRRLASPFPSLLPNIPAPAIGMLCLHRITRGALLHTRSLIRPNAPAVHACLTSRLQLLRVPCSESQFASFALLLVGVAQHYGTYHTTMLVGAGIGLTPSAAIIRAILRYKWKKGYKPVRGWAWSRE
jgi:hypothetical protein